jgi:hypothetical protein
VLGAYFPEFIQRFNGVVFSVVGNISVDSEVPVVTLSFSRCAGIVFRRCGYRGECACILSVCVCVCTCVIRKKKKLCMCHAR